MFHFDDSVLVFDDARVFQPEHLFVMVRVIGRRHSVSRQNFLGNLVMTVGPLRFHSKGHAAVFVEKVTHGPFLANSRALVKRVQRPVRVRIFRKPPKKLGGSCEKNVKAEIKLWSEFSTLPDRELLKGSMRLQNDT